MDGKILSGQSERDRGGFVISKALDEYIADKAEFNLISKEDVALIKIKLGKSHRKESDWDVIKEILLTHDVIVMEPTDPDSSLRVINHILCEDGCLVVFTNMDDCGKHIKNLNLREGKHGRLFNIGVMPFDQAVDIAEDYEMDMYIDVQVEINTSCMEYVHGERKLKALVVRKI